MRGPDLEAFPALYDLGDCGCCSVLVLSSEGFNMSSIFILRRLEGVSAFAGTRPGFRMS